MWSVRHTLKPLYVESSITSLSMNDDWSVDEVEIVVTDYLTMLDAELRGSSYNKAEHNRELRKLLPARSRGSIEFKHQNISAALLEIGFPYVDGYKPLSNFQSLISEVLERQIAQRPEFVAVVASTVTKPEVVPPRVADFLALLVDPPEREKKLPRVNQPTFRPKKRTLLNYLELEARNASLGGAGERLVLEFEHHRLLRAGKKTLAERVEHIANTLGDGAGYDIHSFENDGRDRLIEVKTTRFGAFTPFFATSNEVAFSDLRSADFHLCRLFHFETKPKLFFLSGSLHRTCDLEPAIYQALPGKARG